MTHVRPWRKARCWEMTSYRKGAVLSDLREFALASAWHAHDFSSTGLDSKGFLSNRRNPFFTHLLPLGLQRRALANSAVFGVRTSIIAPTTRATLSTTVLRSVGNAVLSRRPTCSAPVAPFPSSSPRASGCPAQKLSSN